LSLRPFAANTGRNLTGNFGSEVIGVFWEAFYARTAPRFKVAMAKLNVMNQR
jgi:hypothetical protein